MAATISSTATRITISGNYKAFDSTTGSTSTVINYTTGDAPAAGDAGRFLMWKNGADSADWEIRYIESATATTVTVGDGGFSAAPASGQSFVISTNLADINTAEPVACTIAGKAYSFNGRDWGLTSSAFLADIDVSLDTEQSVNTINYNTWNAANGCAVQFGRLTGGEANDSTITRQGCYLSLNSTKASPNSNLFGSGGSEISNGPIFNFYGCYIKNYIPTAADWAFMRGTGPVRMIGSIWDGPMGGAFHHSASELVDTKFRGNTNLTPAWSIRATFTRPVSGVQFANGLAAFKTFQAFTGVFRDTVFDIASLDTVLFLSGQAGGLTTLIDCTTFGDGDITDAGSGTVSQGKSINYTLTDSSGTGLTGAKVAVYDNTATLQDAIEASTSGAVDEIVAIFNQYVDSAPSSNKAPFDIRIRKYDYQYQEFQSSVAEPIRQEYRLPDNAVTVLSEAAAAVLTGIAINFISKTLTITASHTLSELYDYTQSQMALDANMDEIEFLKSQDGNVFTFNADWDLILGASGDITSASSKTIVFDGTGELILQNAGNNIDGLTITGDINLGALVTPITGVTAATIDFSVAGTYNFINCTINEVTNSSGGAVAIVRTNTVITTNTGPSITLTDAAITLTIEANVTLLGAEVRIYDLDGAGNDLGTELDGVESAVGSTFATTTVVNTNQIWIQILKDGCIEFGQSFTMPAIDATFTATLTIDNNE